MQPDSSTSLDTAKQKPDNFHQEASESSVVASDSIVSAVRTEEPLTDHLQVNSPSVRESMC